MFGRKSKIDEIGTDLYGPLDRFGEKGPDNYSSYSLKGRLDSVEAAYRSLNREFDEFYTRLKDLEDFFGVEYLKCPRNITEYPKYVFKSWSED